MKPRAAEFFAGIGLVRQGLEEAGFEVVFANDIEPMKADLYGENYGLEDFVLGDIRQLSGLEMPEVELATASFPCTDLSLAGNRAGLLGEQSGMFWEFARILGEMSKKPDAVLLENVPSFASSRGGEDLKAAVMALNDLGYKCDLIALDARFFVPQSRPRLFIVGSLCPLDLGPDTERAPALRPTWLEAFLDRHGMNLDLDPSHLPPVPTSGEKLGGIVERLPAEDSRWWPAEKVRLFVESLSEVQSRRLSEMLEQAQTTWRTAYRRTRKGRAVWEIRADEISGCLRTARGGSSRQALVEAGSGTLRIRWMTPREYGRLQGVEDTFRISEVSNIQALFGFGDAVCVPAITWVAQNALLPRIELSSELALIA